MNSGEQYPPVRLAFRSKKGSNQESKCAAQMLHHWSIDIDEMDCGSCVAHTEKTLQKLSGY